MNWHRAGLLTALLLGLATAASGQMEGQTVKGFRLPEYDADGKLVEPIKYASLYDNDEDGEVTARASIASFADTSPPQQRAAS